MHAIADRIVDEYLAVVEAVEDDIDEMENAVFTTEKPVDIEQIYLLKREILGLRRAVAPLAPAAASAGRRRRTRWSPAEIREYFRDVEDHLSRGGRAGVDLRRDARPHWSAPRWPRSTTRQNEDMRKISAWAAIALVPTAIAGIYGMNFEHMPELGFKYGYPLTLGVILALCLLLYRIFRKNRWL